MENAGIHNSNSFPGKGEELSQPSEPHSPRTKDEATKDTTPAPEPKSRERTQGSDNFTADGERNALDVIRRGERLALLIAAIVAVATVGQWITTCENNGSTSRQTERLISQAQIESSASQRFAASAEDINRGVANAVAELQAQVEQIERSRSSSDKNSRDALQATIDNFHREQRAWVGIQGITCGHCPARGDSGEPIDINDSVVFLVNSGKTPALHVRELIIPVQRRLTDPIPTLADAKKSLKGQQPLIIATAPPEDRKIAELLNNLEEGENTLPPNVSEQIKVGPVPIFAASAAPGLNRMIWYLLGEITYFDVYNSKQHHTTFCVIAGDQFPIDRKVDFHFCKSGNRMD